MSSSWRWWTTTAWKLLASNSRSDSSVAADAFGNALGASLAQANSAPAPQAWDGTLYGSAPSYSYLDKTPVPGVFTQPSSAASSFDSDAAYNQLVAGFSDTQNGTSGVPGVLLATNNVANPGEPVGFDVSPEGIARIVADFAS